MRERDRKSIEIDKMLPQFTTMNVIEGQAGLVNYSSLIFYSLTLNNILNIIALLILAGVTIATLTGENGILTRASDAKEETIIAQEKEQIALAQSSSILENGENFTTGEFRKELKNIAGKDKVTVTNAKDKEGEDVIKIHYKDTDHYYHIKNDQIIELDDTYYAKKDITEVWAIYYPNGTNSELVFNTTGNIDNNKTTTGEIEKWEVSRTNYESTSTPWYSNAANITTVTFEEEVVPEYTARWFDNFTNLININNIENLNTSQVISMQRMFRICQSLTSLNLTSFDTSNVTNMSMMFMSCRGLTSVDLSSFDTSNVTNMSMMFMSCKALTSLDLSSFDTSNVTTMSSMLGYCNALTQLDLSDFDTSHVTSMASMFMCSNALTNLDLSGFDTSNVTSMGFMFASCDALSDLNLSSFDTSSVTSMSNMFWECSKLTSLDLSNFDTSNVTNMSSMFKGCSGLISLDLSNFDTSNVTDMSSMFSNCFALTSLDLSHFNTSNVTDMNFMFGSPEDGTRTRMNLNEIKGIENFDTSNVTNMEAMFQYCSYLTNLDLTNWNTAKVEDMSYMFFACQSLTEIKVGENWKTASENTSMFGGSCGVSDVTYPTGT